MLTFVKFLLMAEHIYTLLELNGSIKTLFAEAYSSPIYVVAEINNITYHSSGHCYMELVQKDSRSDRIVAQLRGTLWASNCRLVCDEFEDVTGRRPGKGMSILAMVRVNFHEIYGLSVNILNIDPQYTLGDLQRRKREIIDRLVDEGIFDANRKLPLPLVLQHIAVVSSAGAAGYSDFIEHLRHNPAGYGFDVRLFHADMQGVNTERTVVDALRQIRSRSQQFDVAVIIRGGGSKSDLSGFDNYNIAREIATLPLPVLSGIGHNRDESIADMVANTQLKTPTAVADFIIAKNHLFETDISKIYENILAVSHRHVLDFGSYLTTISLKLVKTKDLLVRHADYCNKVVFRIRNTLDRTFADRGSRLRDVAGRIAKQPYRIFVDADMRLLNYRTALRYKSHLRLEKEAARQERMTQQVVLSNPVNILRRGYSITKINGRRLTNGMPVAVSDIIETVVLDKRITGTVTKVTCHNSQNDAPEVS